MMKRGVLGVAILFSLLALGWSIAAGMRSVHEEIGLLLQQAEAEAQAGEWQNADGLARQAQAQWQQHYRFTAAFADHTPMDELDGLFAELVVYLNNRESPHFEATCAKLILLTQAMADSHGIQWWNFL